MWCQVGLTNCIFHVSGPPDPAKTGFVRPSSIVICTAGVTHSLVLEPRDEFNNLCKFPEDENPVKGYVVTIKPVRLTRILYIKCVIHIVYTKMSQY